MSSGVYDEYILLVPAIPRKPEPHVYTAGFDLQSLLPSTDPFYRTADVKVNSMIDTITRELRSDGYDVASKVFIAGFSVGGMFGQRYTLLHPERVRAIAAGHCGGNFTLPESTYNGVELNWPVGVNNLESLVGYEFDRVSYTQVPQFIYIGDADTENTIVWPRSWGPKYMWQSVGQLDFLDETFGDTDPVRLANQIKYLNGLGYSNITFKLYAGVGHSNTDSMSRDVLAFFRAHR